MEQSGYAAIRADEISEPGVITSQVIQHILDDELVLADLTGRNPNVYYELAVRHAVRKPVVQIIQSDETIPFDVAITRTIHVDHRDLDSVARCITELVQQIKAVEEDPTRVDSPISMAIDQQVLRQSENPLEKRTAEIMTSLEELKSAVIDLSSRPRFSRVDPDMIGELRFISSRLQEGIERTIKEGPDSDLLEYLEGLARRSQRLLHELERALGMPRTNRVAASYEVARDRAKKRGR